MISRGSGQHQSKKKSSIAPQRPMDSSDPDYSPGLGQVLIEKEGVFWGTRSKIAVPYAHSIKDSTSPKTMRSIFNWSNEEEKEANGYASTSTVSST
jgi:hypothetical protein